MSDSETDARVESRTPEREERSPDGREAQPDDERLELAARAELLAAENRRLRTEYARLRRTRYRQTALGLAGLGLLAALAGYVLPDGREVLFALAATGLFGGLLTYTLTPGRFVAADVGERIYAAAARNGAAIADALGVDGASVYLPGSDEREGTAGRLYLPQRAGDDLLAELTGRAERDELASLTGPFVTDRDRRGLILEPTGGPLYREFERDLVDTPESSPTELASQLADAIVEGFELADAATPDVDVADGRATVAVTGSALGDVDRFDHPIASLLAVGFAAGLERPVSLEVTPGDDRADWLVTCRWQPEE